MMRSAVYITAIVVGLWSPVYGLRVTAQDPRSRACSSDRQSQRGIQSRCQLPGQRQYVHPGTDGEQDVEQRQGRNPAVPLGDVEHSAAGDGKQFGRRKPESGTKGD